VTRVALGIQSGGDHEYADGTDEEMIVLQVVDTEGNPLPYSRSLYVQENRSVQIYIVNNTIIGLIDETYIDTDSFGIATISISDSVIETVIVTVTTDGYIVPGTDPEEANLPENNENISIYLI